jgi:DNA polymerase III alpha subunit (gram-positive type)
MKSGSPDNVKKIMEDTILLGRAGVGKTQSIIDRVKYIITNYSLTKNDIIIINYSESTRNNFISRIKEIKNYNKYFLLSRIHTFETFTKKIIDNICVNKSSVPELMCIRLRDYLMNTTEQILVKNELLKSFKIIFIDDAQDLTDIQGDILLNMSKKNKSTLNLMGDPNQSICSFKDCSSNFLLNFKAKIFTLTENKRSDINIIKFSENIINKTIPFNFLDSKNISIRSNKDYNDIINFIKSIKNKSSVAIFSPKSNDVHTISNLLEKNGTNNNIIVSTYTQSKGLEFDHVIIVNCHFWLFGYEPSHDEYNEHLRLLYVVTSRAKKEITIFHNVTQMLHPAIKNELSIHLLKSIDHKINIDDLLNNSMIEHKIDSMYELLTINHTLTKELISESDYKIVKSDIDKLINFTLCPEIPMDSRTFNRIHEPLYNKYCKETDNIINYLVKHNESKKNIYVEYKNLGLSGIINYVTTDSIYFDIINSKNEMKKRFISTLIKNFIYNKTYVFVYKIFVQGTIYEYTICIKNEYMFPLLNIISDLTNLKFKKINLVYDTETTGLINDETNEYPKIIELSICDSDFGMIVYNDLIDPKEKLKLFITQLTGITDDMLQNKKNIDFHITNLRYVFRNVESMTLIAYNGTRFDDRLIKHYKIFNYMRPKIKFIDALYLFRIYLNEKLENYKLKTVYEYVMKKPLTGHRALCDTMAVIEIIKKLQISL